ncbi:MAG: phage shock protein A [Proteobacteria bacterium]|nr:phage shock protein A [Pseudomonadota bacterium]
MGILDRVSTILRANINALLDQAEDPELVLTQILSDMKDAIAQARTQVAEMIAQEKLFQGDMEKNQAQAQEWARKAELALGRGSEELAKEALRRKVDYDRNASSYMQQLIAQQQVVTKLKSDLNALQSKYDSAMRNRESMIARHKAAMAQQKIAATAQQLSAIDPSSEIARMDAKIRLEEARAAAALEVNEHLSLDDKFADLEDDGEVSSQPVCLATGSPARGTSKTSVLLGSPWPQVRCRRPIPTNTRQMSG